MEDIAPKLLQQIREDFETLMQGTDWNGSTYTEASEYAETVANTLAEAFRRNLTPDVLPDGKLYWNIADRVVRPMLERDHTLVADAAQEAQKLLNKKAGIGLKSQRASLNPDKVDGILNKLAASDEFEEVAWVLDEPVKTFSRSIVDDTLKRNAEFQYRAGLQPRIIRRAESNCCPWCKNLEGVYDYPDVPREVYQRHERCRCRVDYDPGVGKRRQDVHTKKWKNASKDDTLKQRKEIGLKPLSDSSYPITKGFSKQNLNEHFLKHGFEYAGITKEQYGEIALELAQSSLSADILGYNTNNGGIVRYRISTNDYVKAYPRTGIATLFKPTDGQAYFNRKRKKEGV